MGEECWIVPVFGLVRVREDRSELEGRRAYGSLMKLLETLVVRDEVDIVDTQIEYHLNAGVTS